MQERTQSLLKRADVAMYAAKAAGKGRVAIADALDPPASSARLPAEGPSDDDEVLLAPVTHIGGI
jgi:hypothetical protein